jgi:uncharacterized phage-associated protein
LQEIVRETERLKTTYRKMIYIILAVFLTVLFLVTLRKEEKQIVSNQNINAMAYNPTTVANYFIKKYSESGDLTPLKLIKLSYIAYGWYLALTEGKKLINDKIEAWELGPVFPSLYQNLKEYKKSAIKEPVKIQTNDTISDEDSKFLDRIWEIYGKRDGIYLSAITHTPDTPWSETYPKGFNLEIPDALIQAHYKSKMKPKTETA